MDIYLGSRLVGRSAGRRALFLLLLRWNIVEQRGEEEEGGGGGTASCSLSELKNSAIKFRIGNRKEEERKWDRKSD